MDQYQTLSLLNLAMIQNGIFSLGVFFILWVALRMAVQVRGESSTVLAKVLTTLFGLRWCCLDCRYLPIAPTRSLPQPKALPPSKHLGRP